MPQPTDVGAALLARDRASRSLGIEMVEAGTASAVVKMEVRPDMVNGHDVCHGGLIFTLADTALALACNGANVNTLAAAASIDFVRPARLGALLVATATAIEQRGRTGHYDVVVRDGAEVVALFRGRTREIGGAVVEAATPLGRQPGDAS